MKKILALLLALMMLLSCCACGEQFTLWKTSFNNSTARLLEEYDSFRVQLLENGEVYGEYYADDGCIFEQQIGWTMYLQNDMGFYRNDETGLYSALVYVTPDDGLQAENAEYRESRYFSLAMRNDVVWDDVLSVTEADGMITMTTALADSEVEDLQELYGQKLVESSSEYVMYAENNTLVSSKVAVTFEDGTGYVWEAICTYNVPAPEAMEEYVAYTKQTEDLCTVTLVFAPGTDDEVTEQVECIRGMALGLLQADDEEMTIKMYADAACTEPYAPSGEGDYTSDRTVYIQWVK